MQFEMRVARLDSFYSHNSIRMALKFALVLLSHSINYSLLGGRPIGTFSI